MDLPTFKKMAEDTTNAPPTTDPDTLERKFWKNVPMNPPLYGADVPGSLFDERITGWNLKHLNSLLSRTLEENNAAIPGVTQPYLYAGSWRSFFAWHTEDLDLHSVNYIHTGAPKTWYVVPPASRERFELMARDLLPELSRYCPEFLRHKEILLSPALLAAHNIQVVKTVHNAREFVVVGPGAYHAGFNHGFNIAESVNFATPAWVSVGARASFCTCRSDSVKIDMRLFLDYMDEELAEEVKESYASDSEEESDEEESEDDEVDSSESEEEEEEKERVDVGVAEESEANESSEEESSSSESDSESEEEDEELPAKRVRKPSAKVIANGMAPTWVGPPHTSVKKTGKCCAKHSRSPPSKGGKPQAPANRSKQQQQKAKPKVLAPRKITKSPTVAQPTVMATRATTRPQAQKRRQAQVLTRPKTRSAPAPASTAAAGQKRQTTVAAGRREKRQQAELQINTAAAAHVHASSSDDEAGRAGSKRGAAKAWYRLFDSLLPALKRVRA